MKKHWVIVQLDIHFYNKLQKKATPASMQNEQKNNQAGK